MHQLESLLRERLQLNQINLQPVMGGDINEAYRVDTDQGVFFLKCNTRPESHDMFLAEKRGLELLRSKGQLRVPDPIEVFEMSGVACLLLEWIDTGRGNSQSWQSFATQLSELHQSKGGQFGLDHDNYIGRLPQKNEPKEDWLDFYHACRIMPQLKMAVDESKLDAGMAVRAERMFTLISGEIPEESPTLLHGDLWSGNLLFDFGNRPVFIDPAVYYGVREMDLAMMSLFGGFSEGINIYHEMFPLSHHWQDRLRFYQLYYILVHVNLFGGHYANSARQIIQHYASIS